MISAWNHEDVILISPNKAHKAIVSELIEIAMGAPTSGKLIIDDLNLDLPVGPSAVWSDCSKYFAIPVWTQKYLNIGLFDVQTKTMNIGKSRFGVIELDKLAEGVLTGIDNPLMGRRPLKIDIKSEFDMTRT